MTTEECLPVLRAVGNESRLTLLKALSDGARSVEALSSCTGLAEYNTSRHLRVLKDAGLVMAQRQGREIWYRIRDELLVRDSGAWTLQLGCCSFNLSV